MISVKLCLHVTPLYIVCAATAVRGFRSGRGPGQTAPVWPLRLWMCRLLSGQGPLLCLGWSHLLQILPCWSLHQEVTTHTHAHTHTRAVNDKSHFSPCRCVISALDTKACTSVPSVHLVLNVTMLWGWFIIKSVSQAPGDMAAPRYIIPISMHWTPFLPLCFTALFPLTHLWHFHHMLEMSLSLSAPPLLQSQQTIQAAGCSPWQRRPAVQWTANWWLVHKMAVCVCVWVGMLVCIYW